MTKRKPQQSIWMQIARHLEEHRVMLPPGDQPMWAVDVERDGVVHRLIVLRREDAESIVDACGMRLVESTP